MGILDGNPKNEPLHYGEVFGIWGFLMNVKGMESALQAFKNHAGDKDLKQFIDDLLTQGSQEITECETLLKENGIMPPPSSPSRPEVNFEEIPVGARFSDMEISGALAKEMAAGIVACSQIIGQSIREDVGTLFAKYHVAKLTLSARLLRMNKQKGWIIPPPLQVKEKEAVGV